MPAADQHRSQFGGVLRRHPRGHRRPAGLEIPDRLLQQLRVDRRRIQLLQQFDRPADDALGVVLTGAVQDPGQRGLRIGVAGPDPFGVEHTQPAEPADLLDHGGRGDGVGGWFSIGSSNRYASICQDVLTIDDDRVRRDGTIEMSSRV